jgi:hypothetical protein
MSDDSVLSENAVVADRYRIVRLVEETPRRRTYVATPLAGGRNVALKVMRLDANAGADARTRFLQEAKDPSFLDGAQVVEVIESDIRGALPFVAMVLPDAPAGARGSTPGARPGEYVSTVAMTPGGPPQNAPVGYQATVAMSPDSAASDEVLAARAEAARVEAAMMSARRAPSQVPPRRSSASLLVLVVAVLVAAAIVGWFLVRRH